MSPAMSTIIYATLTRDFPQELKGAIELNTDRADLHSVTNYAKRWLLLNPSKSQRLGVNMVGGEDQDDGLMVASVNQHANAGFSDITCHICKKRGHKAIDCPNGAQKITVAKVPESKRVTEISKWGAAARNKNIKCMVCGKMGHTISNCWSHRKSCSIIKNRLLNNKKSVPKEIFTVMADPELFGELKEAFSDAEDQESTVCASLQAMNIQGEKMGEEDL